MTSRIISIHTLVYLLLFGALFFITGYFTTVYFGRIAFENDNVVFDITLGGYTLASFLFNLIGLAIKWIVLSALLYGGFYILKADADYGSSFKIVLLGEFIFLIAPIITITEFFNRTDFIRNDVSKSLHFFDFENILPWFNDVPILDTFNVLNILYFLVVVYLITVVSRISTSKAFGIASWVFIPIYLLKQLFWAYFSL